MRARFNLAKSPVKQKRLGVISRPIPTPCRSASRVVIAGARKSCGILILSSPQKRPAAITKTFIAHPLVESIIAQGPTKSSVRIRSGIQCDLRVVSDAEYPFALNYFTGSKEHNIEMRNRALERGWTLNEYRLALLPPEPKKPKKRSTKKIPKVRDEGELYRALGLDFIAPELRENCGEFEA